MAAQPEIPEALRTELVGPDPVYNGIVAEHPALAPWKLIREAWDEYLNDEWDKANAVIEDPSLDDIPRVLATRAEFAWTKALFTEQEEDAARAAELIQTALTHARSFQESNMVVKAVKKMFTKKKEIPPEMENALAIVRLDCTVIDADLTTMTALLSLKTGGYITGALSLRSGFNLYVQAENTLNSEPTGLYFSEAAGDIAASIRFGIYLLRFGIAGIPPSVKWLTDILGFRGDRDVALENIRAVAAGLSIRSVYSASMVAAISAFQLEKDDDALAIVDYLKQRVPRSFSANYLDGYICRKLGKNEEAIAGFAAVEEYCPVLQLQLNAKREIGRVYLGTQQWEKAEPYLRAFTEETVATTWLPWAHYQLGWSLYFQGKIEEAQQTWAAIADCEINEQQSFACYARAKGGELAAAQQISTVYAGYMAAYFARDCGIPEVGLTLIEFDAATIAADAESCGLGEADLLGLVHFMRGALLRELERYDEAVEALTVAIEEGAAAATDRESLPWALYEMGEINIRRGCGPEAVDYLTRCQAVPMGYNLDRMLQFKVKRVMDKAKAMPAVTEVE